MILYLNFFTEYTRVNIYFLFNRCQFVADACFYLGTDGKAFLFSIEGRYLKQRYVGDSVFNRILCL